MDGRGTILVVVEGSVGKEQEGKEKGVSVVVDVERTSPRANKTQMRLSSFLLSHQAIGFSDTSVVSIHSIHEG